MRRLIRYWLTVLYLVVLRLEFTLRKSVLGWENAALRLRTMDKRVVVQILRKNGAQVGEGCDIESGITLHNCSDLRNLRIGDGCHIGKNCLLDLASRIELGSRVTVSMGCCLITHTDVGKSQRTIDFPRSSAPIVLEPDVYLGCGVAVLSGVTIGRGTVAAAGAVITASTEANSLVAGVPATWRRGLTALQQGPSAGVVTGGGCHP
jgi:acetyltransferase-like isoleucine patch superfamily enzyme